MQKIKRTGNPLSKRFPALHSVPVGAEQASTGRLAPLPRVDATGFEPAASASRTQRSTKLSHASIIIQCDTI